MKSMGRLKLWIGICVAVLSILWRGTIFAQGQTPLRDLLSYEGCSSACWMGMEVDKTTEAELLQFLLANSMSYSSRLMGTQGDLTSYSIISGSNNPSLNGDIPIALYTATGGPVSAIDIPLANVDVNTVIETYGYPDRIIDYHGDRSMIYAEEGIGFRMLDNNIVFVAVILGPSYTTELFIDQSTPGSVFYKDIDDCTDGSQLCEVVNILNAPSVLGFMVVDLDGVAEATTLTDGAILNVAALPANPGIGVDTTDLVNSAIFDLNGQQTLGNTAPFTIPVPPAGSYTLTVTPYPELDGQGNAGIPQSLAFTVVDENASGCIPPNPPLSGDYTVAAGDVAGLLAALGAANGTPGGASVALAPGSTYTLTAVDNAAGYYGNNGLPYITGDVTVYGNCATIERDASAPAFRLFQVDTPGTLALHDLVLSAATPH